MAHGACMTDGSTYSICDMTQEARMTHEAHTGDELMI